MTGRTVLFLDLVDDPESIAAYEAHHAPGGVPEAVLRSIRDAGIVEMEIHRSGDRLVMILETDETFDAAAKAARDRSDAAVVAWEQLMDRFQRALPWASPHEKWVPAQRIFALSEQPA